MTKAKASYLKVGLDVQRASGGSLDVTDYFLELVPYDIQHAYNGHREAKQEGDIPLTEDDFKNIPDYLDEYDELLYVNKDKAGKITLCVSKEINDGHIVVIEVVSKSRGSLQLKTAYGVTEKKYRGDIKEKYKKRNNVNSGGNQNGYFNTPRDTIASFDQSVSQASRSVKKNRLTEYAKYLVNELMGDPEFKERANADTYRLLQETINVAPQGEELKVIGVFMLIRELAASGISLRDIRNKVRNQGGVAYQLVSKIYGNAKGTFVKSLSADAQTAYKKLGLDAGKQNAWLQLYHAGETSTQVSSFKGTDLTPLQAKVAYNYGKKASEARLTAERQSDIINQNDATQTKAIPGNATAVSTLSGEELAEALIIAGRNGLEIEDVYDGEITDTMRAIYYEGKRGAGAIGRTNVTVKKGRGTLSDRTNGTYGPQLNVEQMRRFAKVMGTDVEILPDGSIDGKAAFEVGAFKIIVTENATMTDFMHEALEAMAALSGQDFDHVTKMMVRHYLNHNHTLQELDDVIAQRMVTYNTKNYAFARKEWVCTYAAELLSTKDGVEALFGWLDQHDKSGRAKKSLLKFIKRLWEKIKAMCNGDWIGTAEKRRTQKLTAELQGIITGLENTRTRLSSLQNGQTVEVGGGESKVRYAKDDNSGFDFSIFDDPLYPKTETERSVFNRSMANKTSYLREGETDNIMIFTANDCYFVIAEGYLKGHIAKKVQISGNEQLLRKMRMEFMYGTDKDGKDIDGGLKIIRSRNGGRSRDTVAVAKRGRTETIVSLDGGQSQRNNGRNETSSVHDRWALSVVTELDNEYRKAISSLFDNSVNGGQQKADEAYRKINDLVGRAARAAGYTETWYHGTNEDWNEYDLSRNNPMHAQFGEGIYLAKSPSAARMYGDIVKKLYVKPGLSYRDAKKNGGTKGHLRAKKDGKEIGVMVVYDPNQIKLADVIVQDDDGRIIPLSERFDAAKTDVRYSMNIAASEEQVEKVKRALPSADAQMIGEMTAEMAHKTDLSSKGKNVRGNFGFYSGDDATIRRSGWARNLFSAEDRILLNQRIAEIMRLKKRGNAIWLSGNHYLFDINNKIVIVGGTFEKPIIQYVMVLNAENATVAAKYKEAILDANYFTGTPAKMAGLYCDIIGSHESETNIVTYHRVSFATAKKTAKKDERFADAPTGFSAYGYTQEKRNGTDVFDETKRTRERIVDYSLATETVDESVLADVTAKSDALREQTLGKYTAEMDELAQSGKDRASGMGELQNKYYSVLSKQQWRAYYKHITDNGLLRANVGDAFVYSIGDKILISEKRWITDDTQDFQVVQAYRIDLPERVAIVDKIIDRYWGIIRNYVDDGTIYDELVQTCREYGSEELPELVDPDDDWVHKNNSKRKQETHATRMYEGDRDELSGDGISSRDQQGVSEIQSKYAKLRYSRDTATVAEEQVESVKRTLPSADAQMIGEMTAEMDRMARNSERIPMGERPKRNIAVPRKVNGKKTMRWARTFFESGVGEPEMVDPGAYKSRNEINPLWDL